MIRIYSVFFLLTQIVTPATIFARTVPTNTAACSGESGPNGCFAQYITH